MRLLAAWLGLVVGLTLAGPATSAIAAHAAGAHASRAIAADATGAAVPAAAHAARPVADGDQHRTTPLPAAPATGALPAVPLALVLCLLPATTALTGTRRPSAPVRGPPTRIA